MVNADFWNRGALGGRAAIDAVMMQFLERITQWEPIAWILQQLSQYGTVLGWAAVVSGVAGTLVLFAAPWLVCLIREDYFATKDVPPIRGRSQHPALRWTLRILKNLAGVLLVLLGLTLMPLPGQGMLVALGGLLLLQFPGKRRLEMWIIRRPGLLTLINWMRCRRGYKPLRVWSPNSPVPMTTHIPGCDPPAREKTPRRESESENRESARDSLARERTHIAR